MKKSTIEKLERFVAKNYLEIIKMDYKHRHFAMGRGSTCVFRGTNLPKIIEKEMSADEVLLWANLGSGFRSADDVQKAWNTAKNVLSLLKSQVK